MRDKFQNDVADTKAAISKVKNELASLLYQMDVEEHVPRADVAPERPRTLRSARSSGALHHTNMRTRYDLRRESTDRLPRARRRSL